MDARCLRGHADIRKRCDEGEATYQAVVVELKAVRERVNHFKEKSAFLDNKIITCDLDGLDIILSRPSRSDVIIPHRRPTADGVDGGQPSVDEVQPSADDEAPTKKARLQLAQPADVVEACIGEKREIVRTR